MDMSLLIENLNKSVFTRNDLFQAAKKLDSSFKETQLRYYVEKLRKMNLIMKTGHNIYTKNISDKKIYTPACSETTLQIISVLKEEFPLVMFRIWELSSLNEFLNHLIAHNYIFIEAERDGIGFIYNRMNEIFPKKVLLDPNKKELSLYSADNDIIMTSLITECPAGLTHDYELSLEKLIVDMFSNKVLQAFISKGDYAEALEEMFSKYNINQSRLFRYARRRGKADLIASFLTEKTNIRLEFAE